MLSIVCWRVGVLEGGPVYCNVCWHVGGGPHYV